MVLQSRDFQRYSNRMAGIPELLQKLKDAPDFYVEMKWEFTSWGVFCYKLDIYQVNQVNVELFIICWIFQCLCYHVCVQVTPIRCTNVVPTCASTPHSSASTIQVGSAAIAATYFRDKVNIRRRCACGVLFKILMHVAIQIGEAIRGNRSYVYSLTTSGNVCIFIVLLAVHSHACAAIKRMLEFCCINPMLPYIFS